MLIIVVALYSGFTIPPGGAVHMDAAWVVEIANELSRRNPVILSLQEFRKNVSVVYPNTVRIVVRTIVSQRSQAAQKRRRLTSGSIPTLSTCRLSKR